jgi:hypothetical protein
MASRLVYAFRNCGIEIKKIMDTSNSNRRSSWLHKAMERLADALRGCTNLEGLMISLNGRSSEAQLFQSDDDMKVIVKDLIPTLPSLSAIALDISRSVWWKYELENGQWVVTEKAFRKWSVNSGCQSPDWTHLGGRDWEDNADSSTPEWNWVVGKLSQDKDKRFRFPVCGSR